MLTFKYRGTPVSYEDIMKEIRESHPDSRVYFGCDSVRTEGKGRKATATYSTVICLHRAASGGIMRGCKVWDATVTKVPDYGKVVRSGKMSNLRARMLQEVTFTLEAHREIEGVLVNREWEIHVDINSAANTGSHEAYNDAMGYVIGSTGQKPRFKPDGPAASFAADAAAHGLLH
jgi:predicted RNase H-related nuclease YkuK (DUF458 family)